MSRATLDGFFGQAAMKPKMKCSDCAKVLDPKDPEYKLRVKGELKPYCRDCAKKRLPKPKAEEKYPCEFAQDCGTEDGEHCDKNPDTCSVWKKKLRVEEK